MSRLIYVTDSGDDLDGDGTQTHPFRTENRAMVELEAGNADTIVIVELLQGPLTEAEDQFVGEWNDFWTGGTVTREQVDFSPRLRWAHRRLCSVLLAGIVGFTIGAVVSGPILPIVIGALVGLSCALIDD